MARADYSGWGHQGEFGEKKTIVFKRRSSRVGAPWACLSADNWSLPRRNKERGESKALRVVRRIRGGGHRQMDQTSARGRHTLFSETGGEIDVALGEWSEG